MGAIIDVSTPIQRVTGGARTLVVTHKSVSREAARANFELLWPPRGKHNPWANSHGCLLSSLRGYVDLGNDKGWSEVSVKPRGFLHRFSPAPATQLSTSTIRPYIR